MEILTQENFPRAVRCGQKVKNNNNNNKVFREEEVILSGQSPGAVLEKQRALTLNTELGTGFKMATQGFPVSPIHSLLPG